MTVYRYKLTGPNQSQVLGSISGSVTFGAVTPLFTDVTATSGQLADLSNAMLEQGYAYYATDPTITVAEETSNTIDTQLVQVSEGMPNGAYRETTGTVFPSAIIWWTDSGKTKKIKSKEFTWTGAFPTVVVQKIYASDGTTVVYTITDTVTYSGPFETHRTRAIA